jgi:hypothetical protein
MIHYHGSPVSGRAVDVSVFWTGRHAMVSFANPAEIPVVADVAQSFVLDNGAFSLWSKGIAMDVEAVLDWYREWTTHPNCDWCLIPDTIDGTEAQNDELIEAFPTDLPGVPVWHLHESLGKLDRLCVQFRRVAFGSSGQWATPGTPDWWERMTEVMAVACHANGSPRCKLHGLRMLNPQIFTKLPFSSADSANAAINSGSVARYGMYVPPTSAQRAVVIANRIEAHNSSPVWIHFKQNLVFELE